MRLEVERERRESAREWLSSQGDAILETQIELARTPAPPFNEQGRSKLIASKLDDTLNAEFDEIGNLLVQVPADGTSGVSEPVVVAAHVDTVFGPDTAIEIRRVAGRWIGPGIVDNARGLAVTTAVARAIQKAEVEPRRPIVFAFTVGEEGSGDLRGVRHLFRPRGKLEDAAAFVAVDGSGLRRIIHHALGSRRFRVVVRGAGGHSWTDWGRPNPANAIGEFIHLLSKIDLPRHPRTTLTPARLGGGTSINAIPAESWIELDLRSEEASVQVKVEEEIRRALELSVAAEESRGEGSLEVEMRLIGERPAARLPSTHPLVQAAEEATRAFGAQPELCVSSTDANIPLSLGIPAIAIGAGGESGDTHTEHEWFEDTDGATGALRLLRLLATIAGF